MKDSKVPKNFYRKHRENMVNESEEIAKMIISQTKDIINVCGCSDLCHCKETGLDQTSPHYKKMRHEIG
jgi:hypothetical protein